MSLMKEIIFFFFIPSFNLRPETTIAIHLLHFVPSAFTGKNYFNMYTHYCIKLETILYAFVRDTNIDGTWDESFMHQKKKNPDSHKYM